MCFKARALRRRPEHKFNLNSPSPVTLASTERNMRPEAFTDLAWLRQAADAPSTKLLSFKKVVLEGLSVRRSHNKWLYKEMIW